MDLNLLAWIGDLTAAGFDIVETRGHTSRDETGRNVNHPMPSIGVHMRHSKLGDLVINAYAVNSRRWTIYGRRFTGKKAQRYMGFVVVGCKEYEIDDYAALTAFLEGKM